MKTIRDQTKERLEAQLRWWKNYNAVCLFIIFPVATIGAMWVGDWRLSATSVVLLIVGVAGVAVWNDAIKGDKNA